jgi:hypothetical protein
MSGCCLVLLLVCLVGTLLPDYHNRRGAKIAVTKRELQSIASALDKYFTTSNSFPAGDSAAMLRTLIGSNSAGTIFLNPRKTNASGEMLDMWSTPYRIEIAGQTNTVMRSAGPNRRFGDKDDIVFDRTNQR